GERHRGRRAHERGCKGYVRNIDHDTLAKAHGIEIRGIARQRALVVGAAGGIVEQGSRHALLREFAQIVDAENHGHCTGYSGVDGLTNLGCCSTIAHGRNIVAQSQTSTPMRLPRTVIALGLVSMFNDLASEIVVPLIPILLATVLGAGPLALGVVEGVADAVAAFLKLWSGRRSDALGGRRKGLTLAGYLISNLARPLLGLAGSWGVVLLLRSVDRLGKGLRTAPRDALIADSTSPESRGYAYGFQRAMDNGGAVGGSLFAAAVLAWSHVGLTNMILLSAIPGFAAILCLAAGVKEPPAPVRRPLPPPLGFSMLSAPMRRYLTVLGLFTLARASETFILLLGHDRGASTVDLLLLWAALNFAKALT